MTLNITVLPSKAYYQSADYRLSHPSGMPIGIPSSKFVVIQQRDWSGSLTYAGVGRVGSTDTAVTAKRWLKGIDPGESIAGVATIIRTKASNWLSRIPGTHHHTFVVAGFTQGAPSAKVISNFQYADGSTFDRSHVFKESEVSCRGASRVVITGYSYDRRDESFNRVVRQARKKLSRIADQHQGDPQRVRRCIHEANRTIARLRPNLISEDCSVISTDAYGHTHMESFGRTPSHPLNLVNGIDVDDLIAPLLARLFGKDGGTLVGMTSVGESGTSRPPICIPVASERVGNGTGLALLPLSETDGRRALPLFGSDVQRVFVGRGAPSLGSPHYPCVWLSASEVRFLSHGGGLGGVANWIGAGGTILGHTRLPDGRSVACEWNTQGWERVDFGYDAGIHSGANAGNARGDRVGSASKHPTDRGLHFRPALWRAGGETVVAEDIPADWGGAVDINDTGKIVVRLHRGNAVHAFVWTGQKVTDLGDPDEGIGNIYPKKILRDGSVFALGILRNGERHCYICSSSRVWTSAMAIHPDREFVCANEEMSIAGFDVIDGYRVPWIKRDGGPIEHLPYLQNHHHTPTWLSDGGEVLGRASADYCEHPVAWMAPRSE